MASVALEGVSKIYGVEKRSGVELVHDWSKDLTAEKSSRELALEEITLRVEDGEFLCVIGPSGCGKSTLLRIVAGLIKPTAGTVKLDDHVVNDLEARERGVGLVFQDYALYPHMDSESDMTFSFRVRKRRPEEMEENLKRTVEILGVGIEELLYRKPDTLSGGQKQRVALGRCMIKDPPVFLLDEPLSNLDAELRERVRYELKQIHQLLRTTVIYVTHDQQEAMALGTRIAVLNKGRLIQLGTPRELYARPRDTFVAGFLGSPPMNLLPCAALREAGSWLVKAGDSRRGGPRSAAAALEERQARLQAPAAGMPVILGIRPEHIAFDEGRDRGLEGGITGRVTLIEHTMPRSIFQVDSGLPQRLLVKADSSTPVKEGDEVVVVPDMRRAVLFDAESGEAI